MSILTCDITVYANTTHIQQVLIGYFLLKQQAMINLKSQFEFVDFNDMNKDQHIRDAKKYHVQVVLDNTIVVYYDMHDSFEIDREVLNRVDVYFKRSYLSSYFDTFEKELSSKVFEWGLNYEVFPNTIDFDNVKRSLFLSKGKEKILSFMRAINLPSSLTNAAKLKDIEALPMSSDKTNRKVVFMVRTWDPFDKKDRTPQKIEERKEINETRALCIRGLKKEFGNSFYGGFAQSEYANKYYPDCVITENGLTKKSRYLDFLKQFSICIASTGLHDSIGWKFR